MMTPLFLNHISHTTPKIDDKPLHTLLTSFAIETRRQSRLTRLCLAALAPALSTNITANHLLLAAPSGSPHKLRQAVDSLHQYQLPNLLDFNAALPNATLFACSQLANISGSSIFCVLSTENIMQPLWLAANTLWQQGGSAWLGWACEHLPNQPNEDGCVWWHISQQPQPNSLACLQLQPTTNPIPFSTYPNIFSAIQTLQQPAPSLPSGGNTTWQWEVSKLSTTTQAACKQ